MAFNDKSNNKNLLRLAIQQSLDCDCHSGLKARMPLNVIFFVVARLVSRFSHTPQFLHKESVWFDVKYLQFTLLYFAPPTPCEIAHRADMRIDP